MQRRGDRADGKAQLESQRDVDQDARERQDGGENALPAQLLADDRPDDLRPFRRQLEAADVALLQGGDDGVDFLAQVAADFLPVRRTRIMTVWFSAGP